MNKYELIKKIEDFAPLDTQESWDASGWIVDLENPEVNKVMFALTVTEDVFAQAYRQKCDLIISHHPLFYVPYNYRKINIYCAHTNLDKAKGGTTDLYPFLSSEFSTQQDYRGAHKVYREEGRCRYKDRVHPRGNSRG